MKFVFIQLAGFIADARAAGLSTEDIRAIELDIMEYPDAPVMRGTGGLRKMRYAPLKTGAGKSGGVRVCYFTIDAAYHVYLVTVFAKNEKDNLSAADRGEMARVIAAVKKRYR